VQDKMETKRRTTSLGTGPLDTSAPGAGTSASGRRPETGSLPEPAQAPQVIYLPAPKVEPKPKASPKPKAPVRPRGKAARSVYAKQPAEETLAQARQRLGDGDREGSAEAFAYLVNTSQFLDEIIAELEAFTGASRGASPLLQVLGDAYMKNDRLQKALDTYRRALEEL
jgi:tetratricopeptide (TPR) repeat protein